MGGLLRCIAFVGASALIHLAALLALPEGFGAGGGGDAGDGGPEPAVSGADAEIAALVAAWERPPETGEAGALSDPAAAEAAADLPAAEAALEAVEAGEATEALAETDDPGPTPGRPVMAALPTPDTRAPSALVARAPAPAMTAPVADTGPDSPAGPRPGGGIGGMAALSPGGSPAPTRPAAPPAEESMAPRMAPAPRSRAQAAAARDGAGPASETSAPGAPGGLPSAPPGPGAAAPAGPAARSASDASKAAPESSPAGPEPAAAARAPEESPAPATPAGRAAGPDGTVAAETPAPQDTPQGSPEPGADEAARADADRPAPQAAAADAAGTDAPATEPREARTAAGGAPGAGAEGTGTDALRRSYGDRVRSAIDRQKRYPPSARLRGAEGAAVLRLSITRSGALRTARLARTSGNDTLDAAALAAARAVGTFPPAPESLPGGPFEFRVPVDFRLR